MEWTIEEIRKIGKALSNDKKVKLLNLAASDKHNITGLRRKIGLTIQSISRYVRELEEAGLIKTEEVINEKGRNIMVTSLFKVNTNRVLVKI